MFRTKVWLVLAVIMVNGAPALAQGPGQAKPPAPSIYGYPGAYGYPGYPTPGYDPQGAGGQPPAGAPMLPGYQAPPGYPPMMPGMAPNSGVPNWYVPPSGPVGNPAPMGPNGPYLAPGPGGPLNGPYIAPQPPGPGGRTLPNYDGVGPRNGAQEPYLMKPDPAPAAPNPPPAPPDYGPPMMAMDAPFAQAGYIPFGMPAEPYDLHEGKRFFSEIKQDDTHVWVDVSFIHWWVRRDNTPPLVTTASPTNPTAGTLGNSDTVVLAGGGAIGPAEFSGLQITAGLWLDPEHTQAIEVGGFWLGKNSRQYDFTSSPNGSPVLAQPVIVGGAESALLASQPGNFAGSILVNNIMDLYGAELNFALNAYRINNWTFDYFAGVRYLYLNDNLSLNQNVTVLPGSAGIPFLGANQGPGSAFQFYDSFNSTNRFYGGQLGGRVNWTYGGWDLGATFKLGMGATTHTVIIDGTTTLNATNGTSGTASGGTLTQASNIGTHNSTDFSVVPELNATLSYQFTQHLRLFVGYNLLIWTQVERASSQIDRRIDFTQVPTSPIFTPGTTGSTPQFPNARSDFWAQGLNLGMEIKF